MKKTQYLLKELKEHAPFTALATITAVLFVFLSYHYLRPMISEESFHVFHFLHIIASAMVTAGIFYKYKNQIIPSVLVGVSGAVIIGSLSDVVFPYLGWVLMKLDVHFHLPLVEETLPVLFFALIGSFAGVLMKKTKYPHFVHVFLSVFASLFYLLTFSLAFSPIYFIGAFFVVFIAVLVPCCLSDIAFPFVFVNKK
jgi:Na+/H+-dicarboxylate symporter